MPRNFFCLGAEDLKVAEAGAEELEVAGLGAVELEAADPGAEELEAADLGAERGAGRKGAESRPSKVAPGGLEDQVETGRWRLGGGDWSVEAGRWTGQEDGESLGKAGALVPGARWSWP